MNLIKIKGTVLRLSVLISIFLLSNNLSAWNVLYSSLSNPGKGNCQNICRNLNNNGSLTASVWVENGITPIASNIKLLEVDDNGDLIRENLLQLTFPVSSAVIKRIELHRIVINQDSNSYVLLGTAHNPFSTFPTTRSFLMKIDVALNSVQLIFLDEYFDYYDFTITPITGQIVCVGTIGIFDRLKAPSRRAVLTTLDKNFVCQGLNLMPQSFPLSGNITRFDNIKVIKSYYDFSSNTEMIFIAGHTTRDTINGSNIYFYPQLFVSKLQIGNTGALSQVWFSNINTTKIGLKHLDEVVPCDLIFDSARNVVALINSSSDLSAYGTTFLTSHLCIIDAIMGNPLKFFTYEGPGMVTNKLSLHTMFGQTIQLKSSGKYCINGWANNYIYPSTVYGKYNFYQVDFDPQLSTFDSLKLIIGRSSAYLGGQHTDFYGIYTDTGYNVGPGLIELGVYFTPHSMLVYKDSIGVDQEVVVWFSNSIVNSNDEMRIWSSKNGQGDNGNICLGSKLYVNSSESPYEVEHKTINWQYVPCIEFTPSIANPRTNNFVKSLCDGSFD